MFLGILSDTHGRVTPAEAGVSLLRSMGAQFYIHCGDIGSESVLDTLAGLPALAVWGNNDDPDGPLARYAKSIDVDVRNRFAEIELAGKRIFVTHGDDWRLIDRVIEQQKHDYLLLGHTHHPEDRREGRVRVINPGALHRAARKTVAVVELVGGGVEFLEVR